MSMMNKELQSYLLDAAFEVLLRRIQPLPDEVMSILLCQQEYKSVHAACGSIPKAFQLVRCLTLTKSGKETDQHLSLRTEGLLVSTSSCKLWKAVLDHPCWQSQLRLCCVTICAMDTVPQVTGQAGSALAQSAKVLLPLLTYVWVVHKHLHNRVDVARVSEPVFQREPWHSILPKSALRKRFWHLQKTASC